MHVHGPVAMMQLALRRLPFVALMVVAVLALAAAFVLLCRYEQERRGVGAVESPTLAEALTSNEVFASELPPAGRFDAEITYTAIDAPGSGEVVAPVAWDDAWFTSASDASSYNHELARAAAVIATLAYSESGYYQAASSQPAYMERALAALGFTEVSTDSYRYRSEVVDQVLNLFTADEDDVAYTIARKRVDDGASSTGARSVLLVSIRGSYGSEWLSNFDFLAGADDGQDAGTADAAATGASERDATDVATDVASSGAAVAHAEATAIASRIAGDAAASAGHVVASAGPSASQTVAPDEATATEDGDHPGYEEAAREVCAALAPWIEESRAAGEPVSLLLVGHSRGGAVANLVAAAADDALAVRAGVTSSGDAASSELPLDAGDRVYAYTFAAPRTTVDAAARGARYANIFNVVHPADIMPSLPLESWGYERYGVDMALPAANDEGFDGRYERMCAAYQTAMGQEPTFDPDQVAVIDAVVDEVGAQVASASDLFTPAGVATTLATVAAHVNPLTILEGHYPSVYIAWLRALEADEVQARV